MRSLTKFEVYIGMDLVKIKLCYSRDNLQRNKKMAILCSKSLGATTSLNLN